MPFLGKNPTAGFASIVKDDFTPNGSTTAFTLSKQVANANDIAVFVGNVRQEPTDAYSVSGTTLTMTEAVATGLNFYVLHIAGTIESSVVPADNTITTAKIASSAVTTAKITDANVTDAKIAGMSSSKLTGALPALDGSALTNLDVPTDDYVRVTFSGPNVNNGAVTTLTPTLQGETGGGFTIQNTNQIVPSVAGDYCVIFCAAASINASGGYTPTSYIYKNTSNWYAQGGIRNYTGGSTVDFPSIVTIVGNMNGTSDYLTFRVFQNGANATGSYGVAVIFRLGD